LCLLCHLDELDEEMIGWQILFKIEAKEREEKFCWTLLLFPNELI